jgi:hypothetical protein
MALKFNAERWKKWRENITKHYRFVIMNEDTFEEVGSYKLTLMNLYVFISTLLVVLTWLVFMLIAYTPIKEYLPGFQPVSSNDRRLLELTREVNRMGQEMQAQEVYIKNLQRMLTGNPLREKDVPKATPDQAPTKDGAKVNKVRAPKFKIISEDNGERIGPGLRLQTELATCCRVGDRYVCSTICDAVDFVTRERGRESISWGGQLCCIVW